MVKKVSKLAAKLESTPIKGFNIETPGYGSSRGWDNFLWSLYFLELWHSENISTYYKKTYYP